MIPLVAGIDIGTSGVRVIACDASGDIRGEASQPLESVRDGARFEQDPNAWWHAAAACLRAVVAQTRQIGQIVAVSVAATSGTVCLLDENGKPLRPAIMYADGRSEQEARQIDIFAADLRDRLGYRFNSSWGLPKLAWLARHEPEHIAQARYLAHAGDVITGRLSGDFGVTDMTQALKTGYDLLEGRWPTWIAGELGLPVHKLPTVVPSGQTIGAVTANAASETGLAAGTAVVAGMTDGCASQIASGAVNPGQWLSVLGTTLVVKGVSRDLIRDPMGRVYSHRHPAGFWLPGAASNIGGGALAAWPKDQLTHYDQRTTTLSPTGLAIYPLRGTGERFPFVRPQARGFEEGSPQSDEQRYAATLEGVAYVERLGYDVLEQLGGQVGPVILTAGGGARSAVWSQMRADILGRTVEAVAAPGAAFGAAILAASASLHPDIQHATHAMVKPGTPTAPRAERRDAYEAGYQRFLAACRERGYIGE